MQLRLTGLWRHADFVKLWAGQTISLIGSRITFLALPLTAVLVLEATPAQMGILTAMEMLPALLLGLVAGAWIDRQRRRPILIATDIGRAGLLLFIPLAALVGFLQIWQLYLVGFLVGALGLLFGIAYSAYLPSLIGRGRLVEGNSKLAISRSAAEIAGPGLAGGLVQILTAPVAILVDAISFLLSALCLGLIRTPEPAPKPAEEQQSLWLDIREGLRLVAGNSSLRAMAGSAATINFFNSVFEAVWLIYLARRLAIEPGWLGLLASGGGIGFLLGALLPGRVTRRFGLGPALIIGILFTGLSDLLTPLAGGPLPVVLLILLTGQFCFGVGLTIYQVAHSSLLQMLTPDHLLGRMSATMGVLAWGIVPVGALLGGLMGETLGLRPTLVIAALGELAALTWLLLSPVRLLREAAVQGVQE
jgi:MFS family permease